MKLLIMEYGSREHGKEVCGSLWGRYLVQLSEFSLLLSGAG
jgi:hypothetical protein